MGRLVAIAGLFALLLGGLLGYTAHGHLAAQPVAAADSCQTFPETGKTICGTFLLYWRDHGGLAQQGLPLSDEMNERSTADGKIYRVQYFERAVFEAHPENQPPYDVLLSLLGSAQYQARYGGPTAAPAKIIGQQADYRGYGDSGYIPMRAEVVDIRDNVTLNRSGQILKPNGKFVALLVRITNLGGSSGSLYLPAYGLILADQHNREGHLSSGVLVADTAAETYHLATPYTRVTPGLATDQVLIFDVQPDATDFRLVVAPGYEPR